MGARVRRSKDDDPPEEERPPEAQLRGGRAYAARRVPAVQARGRACNAGTSGVSADPSGTARSADGEIPQHRRALPLKAGSATDCCAGFTTSLSAGVGGREVSMAAGAEPDAVRNSRRAAPKNFATVDGDRSSDGRNLRRTTSLQR